MGSVDEFAQECRITSKNLRRVPKDLRREISAQSKTEIATPLAARVGAAATGPWAAVLNAGTKARASADPTIVVGGLRPRLSGGAGPRQIVYGVEFGGGSRLAVVKSRPRQRGHRRYTTRQFRSRKAPFVYPTITDNMPWVLDRFADIAMTTLSKEVNRSG